MASATATPTAPVQCLGPLRTPSRSRDLDGTSTRCRIAHLIRVLCSHGSCGPASPHLPPRQRTEPPEPAPFTFPGTPRIMFLGANYSLRINRTTSRSWVRLQSSGQVGSEITARLEISSLVCRNCADSRRAVSSVAPDTAVRTMGHRLLLCTQTQGQGQG
jgi:hypothetical protein